MRYAVLVKQVTPKLQPVVDADIEVHDQYSSIQHLTVSNANHEEAVLGTSLPMETNPEHQPTKILSSPHCLSLPPLPPHLATKPADSQNEVSIAIKTLCNIS